MMTPSEKRMEEICAIRRPLSDGEIEEIARLKVRIYNAEYRRKRYWADADFRARTINISAQNVQQRRDKRKTA